LIIINYEVNTLNELLFDGKAQYEYDLRGNQVGKKTDSEQLSMIYDPLGRGTLQTYS